MLEIASRQSEYLILLALLGAALVNLTWGLPESWPSDEVAWIVDRMLTNGSTNTGYFQYPNLTMNVSYLATRFITLPVMGSLGWSQAFVAGYTTRLVSVAFYLLTAFFVSRSVATLFGLRRVPFALFFIGAIGALNHHAHLGTVSSSLFFGTSLAVYFFVRTCKTRNETDFYFSVAAASLAVGAKYNGVFLFASLPLLWRLVFPRFSTGVLLRPLVISGVIAPLVFLLTTPYALLDSPGFIKDVYTWIEVEGPSFGSMNWPEFLDHMRRSYIGFFTVAVLATMLAVLLLTIVYLGKSWLRARHTGELRDGDSTVAVTMLVLGIAFLSYQAVSFRVGIYQSRHYLAGALVFATMFLISWYYARPRLEARYPWARAGIALLTAVIVLFASVNTFGHVWIFSASAKTQTLSVLQNELGKDPAMRIGAIVVPGHTPFQTGIIDDHVDTFYTVEANYEVETYDEYLAVIGNYLRERKPKYIVFEDIVAFWPVFIPKKYAADYGRRLDYENPGLPAWNAMLETIGYEQARIVRTARLPRLIEWLMGSEYEFTSEGVGQKVYLYEEAKEVGSR